MWLVSLWCRTSLSVEQSSRGVAGAGPCHLHPGLLSSGGSALPTFLCEIAWPMSCPATPRPSYWRSVSVLQSVSTARDMRLGHLPSQCVGLSETNPQHFRRPGLRASLLSRPVFLPRGRSSPCGARSQPPRTMWRRRRDGVGLGGVGHVLRPLRTGRLLDLGNPPFLKKRGFLHFRWFVCWHCHWFL